MFKMMSKKDKDLLERHRARLIRDIGLEDGMLLAHLRTRGAITRQQEEYIKAVPDRTSQAGRLLDILQRGDRDTMDKLVYSLRMTGQDLLVDGWLRLPRQPDAWGPSGDTDSAGASSANSLSQSDRLILERSRPDMMRRLSLANGHVLGQLRDRETLTDTEESHIKTLQKSSGNSNGVGHLIDVILRKSSDSMEAFLHTLNQTGYSHIVQILRPPKTEDTFAGKFIKGGSSTAELKRALRDNMKATLDDCRTVLEEGVRDQDGHPYYIEQPCTYTVRGTRSEEHTSIIKIVEESSPGDRIIVYGEAGTGKTTLLRKLARSWIEKSNDRPGLVSKFKFVFLILMREIDERPLLEIICNKLKLIPASSKRDLKKSLELNAKKTMFLFDSYEEMRQGVDNKEIDDLIKAKGSRFSESTVVITSRPGSKLSQVTHEKTARLDDIPPKEVERITERCLHGNWEAAEVLRSFREKTFLQRPFNLALFVYVLQNYKRATESVRLTQVELLNQFLQYLMLAYAKKRGFGKFIPKPGSYLQNTSILQLGDVMRLFRDIAQTCYEERKQNNVILHVRDDYDLKDYLSFGLFTAGDDRCSVLLPHSLFQEYFAAAHLAENPKAWNALFEEIRASSESESPRGKPSGKCQRRLLSTVLESLGLENVVQFLVALAPEKGYSREPINYLDNICSQLGSLFVVECQELYTCMPVNAEYYTDLIRNCRSESGRRVLASAIVNAQLLQVNAVGSRSDLHGMLPYLTYHQCVTSLKKMYNLVLKVNNRQALLSPADGGKTVVICDKFVVAIVYLYDCTIKAEELVIMGVGLYRNLDLPVMMLSRSTTAVDHVRLRDCTLQAGAPDYISELDMKKRIEPECVKRLEHCHTITPSQCHLKLDKCDQVTIHALKIGFPSLFELKIGYQTTLVNETEDELIAWLEHVNLSHEEDGVFSFAPQHEGLSLSLCRLLDILAKKADLRRVEFANYTLLMNITRSFNAAKQTSLSELFLNNCQGGINLCQLLEVCNWCVTLRMVFVKRSRLHGSVRGTRETVRQNNTLYSLNVSLCDGDLAQFMVFCGLCRKLESVCVSDCTMVLDDKDIKLIKPQTRLKAMEFEETSDQQRDAMEKIIPHLRRLFPSARISVSYPRYCSSDSGDEDSYYSDVPCL